MNRKKIFLAVVSALCIAIALLLACGAAGIYREGQALKAADPLSFIYTREKAAAVLRPALLLMAACLILTVIGLVKGIRDEKGSGPVKGVRPQKGAGVSGGEMPGQGQISQKKLRAALFVLAICFIAAGVLNGSAMDVFGKAVNICTECVGLG